MTSNGHVRSMPPRPSEQTVNVMPIVENVGRRSRLLAAQPVAV
jgi:hypothetical protein